MKKQLLIACLYSGIAGTSVAQTTSLPPAPEGTHWVYEQTLYYTDSDQISVTGDTYLPVGYTNSPGGYAQSSSGTIFSGPLSLTAANIPAAGDTLGSNAYVVTLNYIVAMIAFSASDVLVNLDPASQNFSGSKSLFAFLQFGLPGGAGTLTATTGVLNEDFDLTLAPLSVNISPSSASASSADYPVAWTSGEALDFSADAFVSRNLIVNQTDRPGIASATESSPYVLVEIYTTYDRYRLEHLPEPASALHAILGSTLLLRRKR